MPASNASETSCQDVFIDVPNIFWYSDYGGFMKRFQITRAVLPCVFWVFLVTTPKVNVVRAAMPVPNSALNTLSGAEGDVQTISVVVPTGQQTSGTWIDDILVKTVAQKRIGRYSLAGQFPHERLEVIKAKDPLGAVNRLFYQRGWTDGLPIIPPSLDRVDDMLKCTDHSRRDVIGEVQPAGGVATVEKIAANAVMAGCRPEYFPIVIAAVEAIIEPEFNLSGVQTTDENVTPLLIVNGPIARELEINSSFGALGPGWQANATIGRAVRLVMNNIGGGWPGVLSLAGIGQPGRYTLCVAENEAASPWKPLHVELGFSKDFSTVTVMRAETAINVTGGLAELASVMGSLASGFTLRHSGKVAVILAPFTAKELASKGWAKDDVKQYLYDHGRIPLQQWQESWKSTFRADDRSHSIKEWETTGSIPAVKEPKDITVIVAGGDLPIPQHVYFPSWGSPPCRISKEIKVPANWEVLLKRARD
jgi:hypothetical protein